MKTMNELVSNVSGSKKNAKAKEYAHASEWPKCQTVNCPLPTTIKAETKTCGYHYKQHGLEAECTTAAIKENYPYIKKYNEMVFWNVKRWNEMKYQIMGWPVLPATEEEINLPTIYLNRLKRFIDKTITDRAEEIYNQS
jgi:hypothetical protein